MRIPKGDEKKQGPGEIFETIKTENFPQINMRPQVQIQKPQRTPRIINVKNKTTPLHLGIL